MTARESRKRLLLLRNPYDVPREPQGQKSPKKSSSRKVAQKSYFGQIPEIGQKVGLKVGFSLFPLQGNLLVDLLLTYFGICPKPTFELLFG